MNENLKNKKNKYKELEKNITKQYNIKINHINSVINAILKNDTISLEDELVTIIFKKYLELESVKDVANYLNDLGYRVKTGSRIGKRKYKGTDISKIIESDVNVEEELKEVVKELYAQNFILSLM